MNDNTCVCCGAQIPEGRQICPKCEKEDDIGKGTKVNYLRRKNNMNKLKSCPFCGGKAGIQYILGKECVTCKDCNAKMVSDYTPIEILIDMWNRRNNEEE